MPPTGKSIREDLARAKAAYAKNEELRTLQLVATGLRNFVAVKLPATERTQAEGLLREGFANISKLPRVRKYAPNGIPYLKGQEAKLCAVLLPLVKKIEEDVSRETLEATRERKLRLDHAIIKGNTLLAAGNLLEAQRNYRAAVAEYVDEKGLFPLLASRLIDAGQHKAALEYIKRGMEEAPENPRIYDFLLAACGKLEDWGLAERMLLEVRSRAGEQPLLEQAMAMACARLGRWQDAHDAAQCALDADPGLTEAGKILSLAAKKLSPSPAA